MRNFEVGFNRLPSLKAQEAGEVVEIIQPLTQVVAADERSAVAVAAVQHAAKLAKVKGPELQVLVRPVA